MYINIMCIKCHNTKFCFVDCERTTTINPEDSPQLVQQTRGTAGFSAAVHRLLHLPEEAFPQTLKCGGVNTPHWMHPHLIPHSGWLRVRCSCEWPEEEVRRGGAVPCGSAWPELPEG